jgi:type VI secretion system protein ImpE
MTAELLISQGRVGDAMTELQNALRANPSDSTRRAFYAHLLIVQGEWAKAEKQLDTLASIDPGKAVEVQIARHAIRCEVARQEVFSMGREPFILGEPPAWMARLIAANKALVAGNYQQAAELRDSAFEEAPANPGRVGDTAFNWLADADERLGPVLEAFVQGQYYWAPMDRVVAIDIAKPKHIQDVVWITATLTMTNQGNVAALLPVRYPGAPGPDDAHRLSRATSFETLGAGPDGQGGVSVGHGQRLLLTDGGELPILETRRVEFDAPAAT